MSVDAVGTRRRGRGARKAIRETRDIKMLPALKRKLPHTEPLTPEQVEKIDAASMDILENVGVQFRDDIALADWKRAGAKVVGDMVYLDRGLVRGLIASIPETFTYHARNPANNLPFGADHSMFVPMTGAPYLRDLDDVRRNPTLDDLANFHKLSHMLPAMHSSAHHIVEPYDHPISQRHLRITYSSMKHSDKTFMGMTTSPRNAEDVIEMCAILFGDDFIDSHPVVTGNCNGNSPLVWDETMLGAMRAFCKRNQPVLCSPFVLGGANTPASVPATVAQLNAEALSALAYTQVVRKGCPAIYGHYLSTVSMKSGAPMAGTPEISLMNFMIGQMARFYGVPWRTSNTLGGAKTFDAQAGYESAMTPTTSGIPQAGTRRGCIAPWPNSSSTPRCAKWATGWHRGSIGTTLTAPSLLCLISAPAGITLGIPIRWNISKRRFSCPRCLTTTRLSNGRQKARLRSPNGH